MAAGASGVDTVVKLDIVREAAMEKLGDGRGAYCSGRAAQTRRVERVRVALRIMQRFVVFVDWFEIGLAVLQNCVEALTSASAEIESDFRTRRFTTSRTADT